MARSKTIWQFFSYFPGLAVIVAKHAGLPEQLLRQLVRVLAVEYDFVDADVDHHFCADAAGLGRNVDRAIGKHDAVSGALDDGVLLGVDAAAHLVALAAGHVFLFPAATNLGAVGDAARRPIVPRRKNAAILDNYATHLAPKARGAASHQGCNIHEIIIPTGPVFHNAYQPPHKSCCKKQ